MKAQTYSRAQLDSMLAGYDASMVAKPISGAVSVTVPSAGCTYAIDLAGDAELSLVAANGVMVAIDLVTNGHALTIVEGPTIVTDGLSGVMRSRNAWAAGVGGGGSAPQPVEVTPAAPTWIDVNGGGGTYTIPATRGVKYLVAVGTGTPTVAAAGDYVADPKAKITVTATVADENRYYLADGAPAGWSHTFPASKYTLITQIDFSTVPDADEIKTLKTSNGSNLGIEGVLRVTGGKAQNSFSATGAKSDCKLTIVSGTTKTRATGTYALSSASGVDVYVLHQSNSGSTGVIINPDGTYINTASNKSDVTRTDFDTAPLPATGTVVIELDNATQTGTVWVNGVKKFTNVWNGMKQGPVDGFVCVAHGDATHVPASILSMKAETF